MLFRSLELCGAIVRAVRNEYSPEEQADLLCRSPALRDTAVLVVLMSLPVGSSAPMTKDTLTTLQSFVQVLCGYSADGSSKLVDMTTECAAQLGGTPLAAVILFVLMAQWVIDDLRSRSRTSLLLLADVLVDSNDKEST